LGLTVPDPTVLKSFCGSQEASYSGPKNEPGDPALQSVCLLTQLIQATAPAADFDANGSCAMSPDKGWCYVQGAGAKGCSQAIVFGQNSPPAGSVTSLSCFEESPTVVGGADGAP
jgi:hypothetical protein